MRSHVRVAVIGGGVVGCSVLYHLTKLGWKDVVLIERSELTSGSTWHAAGGMHPINGDPNIAKLQGYTINLYKELEAVSGQSCGIHVTGDLFLAGSGERMDWLRLVEGRGRYLGLEVAFVSLDEAARMLPIMDKRHFVGALYNPLGGHIDPSGVTRAYARAARLQGAEIYRFNRVVDTRPRLDGGWDVVTEHGTIIAEHVVNAGGLWARELGRMVGLELPILAMEHQYLVTDDMQEVIEASREMIHVIDFEGEIYMRQEGRGMLMGTYERAGVPWSPRETPWDFGQDLLPPDLDRIAPSLQVGFRHFPAIARAGIKRIVNGPFTFAPDGNPLVGPVRGLRNYWVACGVMAGFSQGGGVGLALAGWMIEGDPGADIWGMDVARFGDWATPAYTDAKVRENYSRRFRIRFPNEELPVARPLRTTPIYDRLAAKGAIFGVSFGLEHALWFAPEGAPREEQVTFRRSNAHEPVAAECRAVRSRVGLIEIANYAKYEVTGAGAEGFLARLLAGRMPATGRIALSPMLNERGKVIGDFTLARLAPERFMLFGSGVAEEYHLRWFERHLPETGVALRSRRSDLVGIAIAGPNSRTLLGRVLDADVSNAAFPFLSIRLAAVGMIPAMVGRISFTGELGYEIWVEPDYERTLYDLLVEAGADLGLTLFGARALLSLRLEKSFGNWAREFRSVYGPYEAGLGRFIAQEKGDFVGRRAALAERAQGPSRRLVAFAVHDSGVDAIGDEPIWHEGKVVGWVTSGGYGHAVGKSIALGYVPAALAQARGGFEIEILGDRRPAALAPVPMYDPEGARMRS